MYNLNWSRKELTKQKLGTFGEYYAKMTLASYGISIYTSEVDDHGIDFVAETKKGFLKFQVKTDRSRTVVIRKEYFDVADDSLYLLLVLLTDGKHPELYIIPTSAWRQKDNKIFVFRAYEEKKSNPEYGINLSAKNIPLLEPYKLEYMIDSIM